MLEMVWGFVQWKNVTRVLTYFKAGNLWQLKAGQPDCRSEILPEANDHCRLS